MSCFVLNALSTQRLSAFSSWGHFGPQNFLTLPWLSEIASQRSFSFKMSVIVDFPTLYCTASSTLERSGFFSFVSQSSRFCAAERLTLFLDISVFLKQKFSVFR